MTNIFHSITHVLNTRKFWVELVIMTLGMVVAAMAVYYFLVPSKLIIGTISGLSIVLAEVSQTLFGVALPVSIIITVINAILLVLAYFLIGKEFGIKTVYTAMILGPIIGLFEKYLPYEKLIDIFYSQSDAVLAGSPLPTSLMGNTWFDLCCFVFLLSASQAVLFKINASTGGLDILAKIVNKYLHFDIGMSVTIAGAIICCTAFAINDFNMVVIGLIGTWINGLVIDYFTAGLNMRKRVCIVSKDYEKVREFIISDLQRGCTLYDVIGGYTKERSIELESLLTKEEFSRLMNFINTNHINAFITAGNVSEVYGLWSSHSRKKINQQYDQR